MRYRVGLSGDARAGRARANADACAVRAVRTDTIAKAEALKDEGNAFFKGATAVHRSRRRHATSRAGLEKKYEQAIERYTSAIELNPTCACCCRGAAAIGGPPPCVSQPSRTTTIVQSPTCATSKPAVPLRCARATAIPDVRPVHLLGTPPGC